MIARLQARVRQLEVETTKLATEREILQRAANYVGDRCQEGTAWTCDVQSIPATAFESCTVHHLLSSPLGRSIR
jgi:hypothetical protein